MSLEYSHCLLVDEYSEDLYRSCHDVLFFFREESFFRYFLFGNWILVFIYPGGIKTIPPGSFKKIELVSSKSVNNNFVLKVKKLNAIYFLL